jgi:hypothetical protein
MVMAVASPLLAALVMAAVVVAGWAAGRQPFWPTPEVTLSEAVATRDLGEALRLIAQEHIDPDSAQPVRAGMLPDNQPAVLTPLAAAVETRRTEMVRLLLDHGASPAAAARTALICRAVALGGEGIVALLLSTGDRSDPRSACDPPHRTND